MAHSDFRTPRLFVTADLAPGMAVPLEREQANYLLNVLRLADGAAVLVFNGRDGEFRTRIAVHGKRAAALVPEERSRPQPADPDLLYLFAPLKHARLDYMVQKAVEMGVGRMRPVMTRHTQASRVNLDRMRANVIEAAEQCGVLHVPPVEDDIALDRLLAGWEAAEPGRRLLFCDEAEDTTDPVPALQALGPGPLALLIGPEGGFSADERRGLRALPYVTAIPLGPRILRADTAAVAALAVIQATIGDWR
ncbi:16S rRNA (uracil(1498)-N(3))-methyltransferase [Methylobrevis pamukkalensis]|uniref:Ribosomal RNA small subunit methyltransferase E n=1 Tax=Methylobrevis pamukkalensis TaxID=1439726 RepID=A0A1E3H5V5_9HYPH|nr:16S rRNA (uracil(1498)-N(3))-methyltransferase [Methylobrevis pamukkalensis]ODN71697.1 Ribosomal RNA small subunit methyltransferase E [Methylobrevis pamukkalensis]